MTLKVSGDLIFMEHKLVQALKEKGINLKLVQASAEELLVEITVLAKPGAKLEKIKVDEYGQVNCFVNAKALGGKANKSILKLLAKKLGTSPSRLEILGGDKSKLKRVLIAFFFAEHRPISYYLEILEQWSEA